MPSSLPSSSSSKYGEVAARGESLDPSRCDISAREAYVTQALALLPGTVDVLILRTLARVPMHGYGISHWILERSAGALLVEDAALYQALHRLHRKGWVEAEWKLSDTGRRAKFYALTATGR